jgi:hypothetical protein
MTREQGIFRSGRWIEWVLATVVACGMVYTMVFLYLNDYLPQPYFYDPNDTWMDWFNTAYWGRDAGVYDSWASVYPPLTFLILRLVGLPYCYNGKNAIAIRECDWLGVVSIHAIYIFCVILIAIVYFRNNRSTSVPRALALATGLPLTHALERGNIVIVAFACLILAHGPIIKSARLRWAAIGVAINLKIYLFASVAPYLLRRKWRWFEGATIATVVIYAVSFAIFGRGTPVEVITNIRTLQQATVSASALLDVWLAATYGPLLGLLNNPDVPVDEMLGSDRVYWMILIATWSLRIVQVTVLASLVCIWLRPEAVGKMRPIGLCLGLALVSVESTGYTQMFVMFYAFLEPWKGWGAKWAIIATYVLCIQFDVHIDEVVTAVRDTFYGHSSKIVTYYLTVGPFLRPAIFYSIPFALACATIKTVWIDIRQQGWKDRWRFRHDLPIMVGEGEARRPA